jgi:biopolymer transport protein ExbD
VRLAKSSFFVAIFLSALTLAQVTTAPVIKVRVSSSQNTCFVGEVAVPCSEVGAKLHAMSVEPGAHIHITGDLKVGYQLLHTALESLDQAGYRTNIGFVTGPEY